MPMWEYQCQVDVDKHPSFLFVGGQDAPVSLNYGSFGVASRYPPPPFERSIQLLTREVPLTPGEVLDMGAVNVDWWGIRGGEFGVSFYMPKPPQPDPDPNHAYAAFRLDVIQANQQTNSLALRIEQTLHPWELEIWNSLVISFSITPS